jgi:hypothetical protein
MHKSPKFALKEGAKLWSVTFNHNPYVIHAPSPTSHYHLDVAGNSILPPKACE